MIKYSIVIPTYGRPAHLIECLASIEMQTIPPQDVFIIDNNGQTETQKLVKKTVESCSSGDVKFAYHKGLINSGAVARNYGTSLVTTDLVAFLDDDVVLDKDYYEKILDVFSGDEHVVGVQGIDRALIESFKINVREKFLGWFWLSLENVLEHSSIIKRKNSNLRPSLAVTHPIPDVDFSVESEWISTCAGVFRADLFKTIEFPKQFVKYSWNEYVYFSHSIYKKQLGTMIYTSAPKYRNVPTDSGRLPVDELVYMAEVYDLYVFFELFNRDACDRLIYIKSRLGRFSIYFARVIFRREYKFRVVLHLLSAFWLAFFNRKAIKRGDLQCYDKKFPLS